MIRESPETSLVNCPSPPGLMILFGFLMVCVASVVLKEWVGGWVGGWVGHWVGRWVQYDVWFDAEYWHVITSGWHGTWHLSRFQLFGFS